MIKTILKVQNLTKCKVTYNIKLFSFFDLKVGGL
jgi:hypothetical protein